MPTDDPITPVLPTVSSGMFVSSESQLRMDFYSPVISLMGFVCLEYSEQVSGDVA